MVKLWDLSNNQPSCVASNNDNKETKKMIFTFQIRMMFFTFIKQDQMDQLLIVCMEVVIPELLTRAILNPVTNYLQRVAMRSPLTT
ncbi:hypothetical protein LOK49_LG01G00765 [Camellia lanceoleosa]|uniref:Uncharacterized protein n=1 Tax=Camellia lanceoleosa TaxID=1840588 RepID=A0ACC0IVC2_9ERIC|nr:hypothetical protein LOK49_LG01G00765 [Camellia lanceoleosa]